MHIDKISKWLLLSLIMGCMHIGGAPPSSSQEKKKSMKSRSQKKRSRKQRKKINRKGRHTRRKGKKPQRGSTGTTKRTKVVMGAFGGTMAVVTGYFVYKENEQKEALDYLYNLNELEKTCREPRVVSKPKRDVTSEERFFKELAEIVSGAKEGANLEALMNSLSEKLNQTQLDVIKSTSFWQNIDHWLLNALQENLAWKDAPLLLDLLCTKYTEVESKENMKVMLNYQAEAADKTLLHRLIEYAYFSLADHYYLPMINVLLKHGADPDLEADIVVDTLMQTSMEMTSIAQAAGIYEYLADSNEFKEKEKRWRST